MSPQRHGHNWDWCVYLDHDAECVRTEACCRVVGKSTVSNCDFDLAQAYTSHLQFVRLLTGDDTINIGHGPTSETSTIQTAQYVDQKTGCTVVLIDTPGFDDSREGITDMDVLEMISRTLGAEGG